MVVQTQLQEPVDITVADRLRVVVDGDGEVGQCALPVGQLGDLVVIDRHSLAE